VDELEPRSFSFNSPHGACPSCTGLGSRLEIDPERVDSQQEPLDRGRRASCPGRGCRWKAHGTARSSRPCAASTAGTSNAPVKDLPPEALDYLMYTPRGEKVVIGYRNERGENTYGATYEGIVPNLERRFRETDSEYIKSELERYMVGRPCPTCEGRRLKPEILAVTIDGADIWQTSTLSISAACEWIAGLLANLTEREQTIARQVLKEISPGSASCWTSGWTI
jgi:excinuclease ABC subunit A